VREKGKGVRREWHHAEESGVGLVWVQRLGAAGTTACGRPGRGAGERETGGWPVGRPVGWGPAGGGEGGYDRWARARENEKEEKKTEIKSNLKLAFKIYSNLIRSK
jgi:hypothetical protein